MLKCATRVHHHPPPALVALEWEDISQTSCNHPSKPLLSIIPGPSHRYKTCLHCYTLHLLATHSYCSYHTIKPEFIRACISVPPHLLHDAAHATLLGAMHCLALSLSTCIGIGKHLPTLVGFKSVTSDSALSTTDTAR